MVPPAQVLGRFGSSIQSLSDTHNLKPFKSFETLSPKMCQVGTCVCNVAGVAVFVFPVPFCMEHQIRAVLRLVIVKVFW